MERRLTRLAGLALAALLAAWSGPVGAQVTGILEPMPRSLARSKVFEPENLRFSAIPTQQGNILLAWGGVGEGDSIRFATAIAAAKPIAEVQFYSPGGSLGEGLKIGYLIREQKLATRVGSGAACFSACNFMFLGGVVRTIDSGGEFGVHMFANNGADILMNDISHPPKSLDEFNDRYPKHALRSYELERLVDSIQKKYPDEKITTENVFRVPEFMRERVDERVKEIQQRSAQIATSIALFLVNMRLPLRFMVVFSSQSNYGNYIMKPDDLRSFNIVTD